MKRFVSFLLMLCLFMSAGCSSNTDKPENMLRVPGGANPPITDPQRTGSFFEVALNCFDRLVETKTVAPLKPELTPGLAEKWEISSDGKVYTFYLRKGVKFHNGEELKADDVLYTFDRMLNPATKSTNTSFVDMIAGAKERLNKTSDKVSGLKVIDDYTIQITLSNPYGPFLSSIASPPCSILNRKATEAAGDKFGIEPKLTIGTGPFKFTEWVVNDHFIVMAFDGYFRGKPKIDGVVFKVTADMDTQRMQFEKGEMDIFDCDYARSQIPYFQGNDKWKNQIVSGQRVGVFFYNFNQNIKPFDDVRVRKAIQLAIDRKTILEKFYYGKGQIVNTIMPPGLAGFNPDAQQIPYDVAKAKALLAEAGYPNGFEMTIAQVTGKADQLQVNEVVQSMLKEIGITVKIQQMDNAAYTSTRNEGKLPAYLNSWSADLNDPDNFLYTFFSTKNAVLRSNNYNNTAVQQQLEKVRTMTDPSLRIKTYQELEKTIVIDDAAWLPLFSLQHLFVVQPYVKNFQPPWNGWSGGSMYGITIEKKTK